MNVIAELPDRFDEETRVFRCFDGALICSHEHHAPMMVELDGTIHEIVYASIRTNVGREAIFN